MQTLGHEGAAERQLLSEEKRQRQEKLVTYLSAVGNIILLATLLVAFIASGRLSSAILMDLT